METDGDRMDNGISGVEGNTNSSTPAPITKRETQRKYWAFTVFDFMETGTSIKGYLSVYAKKAFIGLETCPTTGKQHLQGYMELEKATRLSSLKKTPLGKAHLEPCKGDASSNIVYCSKEGNIWFEHPKPRATLKIISELRPFQKSLENLLLEEPDDRGIIWVCDEAGNKGKSAFCRYLIKKHDALYLTEGKKSDLLNIVYNYVINKDLNIVLVDVPRSNKNISYKTLEEVKNGIICNTKYETGTHLINAPHIIVFANFYPDVDQFTSDRWNIFSITETYELELRNNE